MSTIDIGEPLSEEKKVYKSCGSYIVTLNILKDSKHNLFRRNVVDSSKAKFRCSKAFVIDITHKYTNEKIDEIESDYSRDFIYRVGHYVFSDFDLPLVETCSRGIHFYLTEECAYYHNVPYKYRDCIHKSWFSCGTPGENKIYINGVCQARE